MISEVASQLLAQFEHTLSEMLLDERLEAPLVAIPAALASAPAPAAPAPAAAPSSPPARKTLMRILTTSGKHLTRPD